MSQEVDGATRGSAGGARGRADAAAAERSAGQPADQHGHDPPRRRRRTGTRPHRRDPPQLW